nr:unnamed protein product [Callosobruchus analis]
MKVVFLLTVAFARNIDCKTVPSDLTELQDASSQSNITLKFFETGIRYHFFSHANPNRSQKVRIDTVESIHLTNFDANRETLFIIHGWKSHNESEISYHIREKILDGHDVNVFVVDWHIVAGKSYLNAQGNVRKVGEYIAKFIRKLVELYGLRLDKLKFVGHSLGAHIAGNAGAALNGKVDRIMGLDPAGPLFSFKNIDNRCGLDLAGTCAHSRSYAYYAESLNSESFLAYQCDSYDDYLQGFCIFGHVSVMGMFNVDTSDVVMSKAAAVEIAEAAGATQATALQ